MGYQDATRRRIGLIAGNGTLPLLTAIGAKKKNIEVIAAAFYQETNPRLKKIVDKIYWLNIGELEKLAEIFRKENIDTAIMSGQIRHTFLFADLPIDSELRKLLNSVKDKKTDSLLSAVAGWLKDKGITLMNSTEFLQDYMPAGGVKTKISPTDKEWEDIKFGINIAKHLGAADIGQTVVVKDKMVLAVESIEGTDQTILRGGRFARKDAVIVKASKPSQDLRFDVPVIGPRTINNLRKVKAKILAYEADETIVIDEAVCIKTADRNNICMVAYKSE